jgi:hypothetical protein
MNTIYNPRDFTELDLLALEQELNRIATIFPHDGISRPTKDLWYKEVFKVVQNDNFKCYPSVIDGYYMLTKVDFGLKSVDPRLMIPHDASIVKVIQLDLYFDKKHFRVILFRGLTKYQRNIKLFDTVEIPKSHIIRSAS